jgi:type I restriction-modification system DNA methylase subunit
MSSIEEFKSAILRIRDILRVMSITGMDSMRTISIYILAKNITLDKCKILGIPEIFAWENIIALKKQDGGKQFALDYFYNSGNPDADYLLKYFDDKFQTTKFSFDVRDLNRHQEILAILDKIDFSKIECHMDILGYVYEQHLKTGSSSASRDLGQFFTDRSICNYLVNLCSPKIINGLPESMCDPSMGTGGFITSYIKYMNKLTTINWKVQNSQIYGCDIDPRVAGLASINCFLESGGFAFENVIQKDSLHEDLPITGYDIILANMPFGIKGLKHADVCDRVNKLRIIGTKSEPLFLQLMMVSLNKGGRCAVVVPDGVLINSSKLHDGTRKYLLDNFELHRVIKMDGSFFMNTGIKPSILFFEKTGNPTKTIEFWEVSKNSKNEVSDKMIVKINRDQLDKSSSLDVRKFIVKEDKLVNTEFNMVRLGDIIDYTRGFAFKSSEFKSEGFPVLKVTNLKNGTISFEKMEYVEENKIYSKYLVNTDDIIIVITGSSTGDISINNTINTFYLNQNSVSIKTKSKELIQKYLFYYLKISGFSKKIRDNCSGSAQPFISIENILNFIIPLPSLELQEKIVATLDRIYTDPTIKIEDTIKISNRAMDLLLAKPDGELFMTIIRSQVAINDSKKMISNIRQRMEDIIKLSDEREFDKVKLGDIIDKLQCGSNQKDLELGEYPFYMSNGISQYVNTYQFDGEYVLMARCGTHNDSQYYVNGKFSASDFTYVIKPKSILNAKYLYYNLKFVDWTDFQTGTVMKGIRREILSEFKISLPPLELQKDIVRRLENYDNQIKALENLARDAEDNAKFILDSYFSSKSKDSVLESEESSAVSQDKPKGDIRVKTIDTPKVSQEESQGEPQGEIKILPKPPKKRVVKKKDI